MSQVSLRSRSLRGPEAASSSRTAWPRIHWGYSLIFPIALILLVVTLRVSGGASTSLLELQVENLVSSEQVKGATVTVGDVSYVTDESGSILIERPEDGTDLLVTADGFESVTGAVQAKSGQLQSVQMSPSVVNGIVRDAQTQEPVVEASVALLSADGAEVYSSKTDAFGGYIFKNLPDGARLRVDAGEYGSVDQAVDGRANVHFDMTRSVLSGVVSDDSGSPVQGAIVQVGDTREVTGEDGLFTLEGFPAGEDLGIAAPGFESLSMPIEGDRMDNVQLTPMMVKAVYASWSLLATPGGLDQLIEIANTTEINAIVIDIKQDTIYYDSQVQFFRDAGTVAPIYDVQDVLGKLEENNIYSIARLVVFQDPLVAEAYPELAVHDENGGLWRNEMGVAWVSAFHEELWEANIALAVEATELGFDEIQYDYVRFPSDGDLTTADFGQEYTSETRENAITEFMRRSYKAIHDANGLLAADLFGFITIVDDEQNIGQRFSQLEPYLDFVCMMIYPSHFTEGNIASAAGHPNDFPYETIYESLERAENIAPGAKKKFRPWLQDFSYWNLREYTVDDVRAQIDAAEDFGASGWLLWGDPFDVSVEALRPQEGTD